MALSRITNRLYGSQLLHLLKDTSARNLFIAQLLSQIGDKVGLVAILWYLTNQSSQLAPWFLATSAFPHLILMPFSAEFIRRGGGELQTVIRTDFVRGIFFLVFGILFLNGLTLAVWILFFLSILSNTMGALFNPAILSLPRLISHGKENLESTTSLIESCFSLSAVLGPLLATVLFFPLGLEGILILTGIGYLFAACIERSVKTHSVEELQSAPSSIPQDRVVFWMLIGFFLMNLLLGPVMAFLPLFAKEVYAGSLTSLATLESALGVGALLGTCMLTILPSRGKIEKNILIGLIVIALSYFFFCSSHQLGSGVVGLLALGFSLSLTNVWILNLFQTRPKPNEVLTVMSWVNLISVASLPLSMSLLATILPFIAVRKIALIFSSILVIGTIGIFLSQKRKFA